MSTLASYLTNRRIRQVDFAARLGVGQGTISRLVSGVMRPSLELAVAIERETGGVVTASSWIPATASAPEGSAASEEKDAAA